jgi:hypothetical protein
LWLSERHGRIVAKARAIGISLVQQTRQADGRAGCDATLSFNLFREECSTGSVGSDRLNVDIIKSYE